LAAGILVLSCTTSSYIPIKYQLPTASDQLKGRTVSLTFKDMRTEKNFLSPSAQKEFKNFSGLFSLYLARANQQDELVGGFKVETLFKEAMKSRLEGMGVKVVANPSPTQPVMDIRLMEFFLDYRNLQWITTVSYQAQVSLKGNKATETVTISGERMKVVGRKNAEKHLGEIFSESLNKVNADKLFKQVGF
jgi:hypothetical protein